MSNFTYATLLSTNSYVPGVKVLYRSLHKYGKTKFPFICVCSQNIEKQYIEELENDGIHCVCLNHSALDGISISGQLESFKHWNYTFDKLLLWEMTEYDKIIFLDSDMIVMEPIDELFEKNAMSAVQAGRLMNPDWIRLNSGLIVIEPSLEMFQKLISSINPTIEERLAQGEGFGDQDVINYCCPEWPLDESLHMDERYNMFSWYVSDYYKKGFKGRPKIIHFAGTPKPWMEPNIIQFIRNVIKYYLHNRLCLKAYIAYKMLLFGIR